MSNPTVHAPKGKMTRPLPIRVATLSLRSSATNYEKSSLCASCHARTLIHLESFWFHYAIPSRSFSPSLSIPPHRTSVRDLKAAAEEDGACYICSTLWDRVLESNMSKELGETKIVLEWVEDTHVGFRIGTEGIDSVYFEFLEGDEIPSDTTNSATTNSAQTWSQIHTWMDSCTSTHSVCTSYLPPSGPQWYPTRLLSLGPNTNPTVHLIETAITPPSGPYCTLSHCWGGISFAQTTDSTYRRFLVNIPLQDLPRTFHDAMEVTRNLGARYLWIDSLCIIQGQEGKEDWTREAPLMGMVYSKAWVNIAATGATNSTIGLFRGRDVGNVFPPALRVKNYGKKMGKVFLVDRDYWDRGVLRSPLLKRGWVVQERILATRVLHFGRDMVFWECLTATADERFPSLSPVVEGSWDSKPQAVLPGGDEVIKRERSATETQAVYDVWTNMVRTYTRTQLTFSSDKLVGISGLAEKVQKLLKVRYLAGLWDVELLEQLLWQVDPHWQHRQPDHPPKRPDEYRAPSWTWASIDAPINPRELTNDLENLKHFAHVVHADVTPKGSSLGQVTRGRLVLCGQLKIFEEWMDPEYGRNTHHYLDRNYLLLTSLHLDVAGSLEPKGDYFFLPLHAVYTYNLLESLVLKLVDRKKMYYERVGVLKIHDYREKEPRIWKALKGVRGLPCCQCQEYSELERKGLSTIVII